MNLQRRRKFPTQGNRKIKDEDIERKENVKMEKRERWKNCEGVCMKALERWMF